MQHALAEQTCRYRWDARLLWCSTLRPRCIPPVGNNLRYQVEYILQPDSQKMLPRMLCGNVMTGKASGRV